MSQNSDFSEELDICAQEAALYALGSLPAEEAKKIELRMRSGCPFCLANAERCAAVAEQLSLSVKPVEPAPELRDRLLGRIRTQREVQANTEHRKVVRASDSAWKKSDLPGVEFRPLIGQKTFMLRLQPGTAFPKHDHPHAEQCFVLSGSITDSDGLLLEAGDFVVMSGGIEHGEIRSSSGCTLLIAYAD